MLEANTRMVIIKGPSNSGKSTSILLFIKELMHTNDFRFLCLKDQQRYLNTLNKLELEKHVKDIQCSTLYKDKLMYITSFGDSAVELDRRLKNYIKYADIIVFASHPNNSRSRKFQELFNCWNIKDTDCIVKEACKETELFDKENLIVAKLLKEKVDNLAKGI